MTATNTEAGSPPGPNLVINGDFETGDFTGWNVVATDQYVYVGNDFFPAHTGTDAATLSPFVADGVSSITQTIATIPGQHYELSFWLDDTAGSSNDFTVSWNGAPELSLINAPTFGYREYMYDVVATGDSTALTFAGANDIGYWALDDVSVQTAPQGATTAPQTITPSSVILAPASGNENQAIDLSQAIAITTNYLYTELTVPGDTSNSAYAFAINDAGQVLGYYYDSNAGHRTYFLYDIATGVYTDILDPNAVNGTNVPYQGGLTEAGQVVGTYNASTGAQIPFIYDSRSNSYTEIKDPNGPARTNVQAINGSDQAIGYYFDSNGTTHQFFYDGAGNYTTIRDPNDTNGSTSLIAINNAGQLLGSYNSSGVTHGFIYDSASQTYSDIYDPAAPVGNSMQLQSINSAGEVLGYYYGNSGQQWFVYNGTNYIEINDPSGVNGTRIDQYNNQPLNDAGLVIGYYLDADYNGHGFVLDSHTGTYTNFDDPAGVNGTYPQSITDGGKVLGYYYDANNNENYFVYDVPTGTIAQVNDPAAPPGSIYEDGYAGSGAALGDFYDSNGNDQYFVFDPNRGTYAEISDPLGVIGSTFINAVNASGGAVGDYQDSNYNYPNFVASPDPSSPTVTSITISVPANSGAILTAGALSGTTLMLTPEQLALLQVTPPPEFEGTLTLEVSAAEQMSDGSIVTTAPQPLPVTVNAVAEPPILTLNASSVSGDEHATIDLSSLITVTASDGEPTDPAHDPISVTIAGVPALASLDHGTIVSDERNGSTVWSVDSSDLGSLHLLAGQSRGTFTLSVTATQTEPEDSSTATSTAQQLSLNIAGVPAVPNLIVNVANATQGGAGLNLAGTISVSSGDAPLYFYSDFADPNAASINSNGVSGLNNFGQVVGTYQDAGGLAHGFVYNGGNNYTEIDDSAGVHGTFAQGIDDAGQVVGYYLDTGNTPHGFIYDPSSGVYTEVDDFTLQQRLLPGQHQQCGSGDRILQCRLLQQLLPL